MSKNLIVRRSFLKRFGAALAGLGVYSSGFNLHRVLAQSHSGYCAEEQIKILADVNTFDPKRVFEVPVCLYALSKNARGEIQSERFDQPKCVGTFGDECITLQIIESIRLAVETNAPCDSDVSIKFFDGDFSATLATTYIQDGGQRGYHTGVFEWRAPGGAIQGRMSGVTNAGTHRDPLNGCESCDINGHMEGRLDGVVIDGDLKGCCIFASYIVSFDPTGEGASGGAQAVLEGVVMCDCKDESPPAGVCLDFSGYPDNTPFAAPFTLSGVTFDELSPGGMTPFVNTSGSVTGLQFPEKGIRVTPPSPAAGVTMITGAFANPFDITAYDSSGTVLSQVNIPQTNSANSVSLTGPNIAYVEFVGGTNEGVLVEICFN